YILNRFGTSLLARLTKPAQKMRRTERPLRPQRSRGRCPRRRREATAACAGRPSRTATADFPFTRTEQLCGLRGLCVHPFWCARTHFHARGERTAHDNCEPIVPFSLWPLWPLWFVNPRVWDSLRVER